MEDGGPPASTSLFSTAVKGCMSLSPPGRWFCALTVYPHHLGALTVYEGDPPKTRMIFCRAGPSWDRRPC